MSVRANSFFRLFRSLYNPGERCRQLDRIREAIMRVICETTCDQSRKSASTLLGDVRQEWERRGARLALNSGKRTREELAQYCPRGPNIAGLVGPGMTL